MESDEQDDIQGFVDSLWEKYDVDNNGKLDQEETKKLCKDVVTNVGGEYNEDRFDAVF